MVPPVVPPTGMTDVEIEFCVPCGFLGTAIQTQRDLLETFGGDLDGVRLTPGDGGVFTVRVDDELVWDSREHGGDLDLETIREEVGRRAGAPA